MKAEREIGGGEDGEGLDEDVGYGLVTSKMRVELVAAIREDRGILVRAVILEGAGRKFILRNRVFGGSSEKTKFASIWEGFIPPFR